MYRVGGGGRMALANGLPIAHRPGMTMSDGQEVGTTSVGAHVRPPAADVSPSMPNRAAAGPGNRSSAARRYATPTGDPCPHRVRVDGTVDGSGDCALCGCCLLLIWAAWPNVVAPPTPPEG